jgi:hypothetical protein
MRAKIILVLCSSCIGFANPALAQNPAPTPQSLFEYAATSFAGCLRETVKMGMITKMDPAVFKAGFARTCRAEEAQFRMRGVQEAIRQGRTEAQAIQEIEANIVNGRRIFAADQEKYFSTGQVPK